MRGPFLHSGQRTAAIMRQVLLALTPVTVAAIWRHGAGAALLVLASLTAAVTVEAVLARASVSDGSAAVTGVIFALLLPAAAPVWLAALGGALAVGVGKHAFGGLGKNPFNPAALARVVLMGLVPGYFFAPAWAWDGVTQASPLSKAAGALLPSASALLAGDAPGALAQAAPWAVLLGGLVLLVLRSADWRVPLAYLAGVTLLSLVLPPGDRMAGHAPWLVGNPLPHLLAGGTLLTAFFLLTDPVTAPFSPAGKLVFAAVAALVTVATRLYTPYPDGAALAVLCANASAPLIDRALIWRKLRRAG